MDRFTNRTCVVTGGAQGLGMACVERFLLEGARVAVLDLPGPIAAADRDRLGERVTWAQCDVTQRDQVEDALSRCERELGAADVLVNNAGISAGGEFLEMDDATFLRVLQVNVHGTFVASQVAARQMARAGRGGSIVNLASVAAAVCNADGAAYGASKGAVVSMTRAMAIALAKHDIRVNAVAPGTIESPMTRALQEDPGALATVLSRTPASRLGEAREIAATIVYLGSDDSSYMTGQTLFVDGGRTALNYTVRAEDVPSRQAR